MSEASVSKKAALFPTTQWSDILLQRGDAKRREFLMADFCKQYWRPLYLFARFRGLPPEACEDAVQDVFAKLLASDFLNGLDPARGRLRSYLRKTMDNVLANNREKSTAKKRGGGAPLIEFDAGIEQVVADAEAVSPEEAYNRMWARQVMETAFGKLETEYESGQRKGNFEVIRSIFSAGPAPTYAEVAQENAMTLSQLKSFVHRARARFRALVLEEIEQTVAHQSDITAELSSLFSALGADK